MSDQIPEEALEIAQINPNVAPRTYNYHGISVDFPYDAYPCQEEIMDKILEGVTNSQNCLLESPTGTGKTAALLCSLLAWQRQEEDNIRQAERIHDAPKHNLATVPTIIYATRTHTHMKQVISQLRITSYAKTPMTILASMDATCNNLQVVGQQPEQEGLLARRPPDLIAETETLHFCYYDPESLHWSQHLEVLKANNEDQVWDLEDLANFSRDHGTCPYYELRNVDIKSARIIFCTYNYLLNPGILQAVKLEIANNIVVFDEGHNVEETSRQMASTPSGLLSLGTISSICNYLQERLCQLEGIPLVKIEPMDKFLQIFTALKLFLLRKAQQLLRQDRAAEEVLTFVETLLLLTRIGLGRAKIPELWINYSILEDNHEAVPYDGVAARYKLDRRIVNQIFNLLNVLTYLSQGQSFEYRNQEKYQIVVKAGENYEDTELKLDCLDPAVGFKHMILTRSLIIASATLNPMDIFSSELGMYFQQRCSPNSHIIPLERIFSVRINEGLYLDFNGVRDSHAQFKLATIILNIARIVPHGMLVFLPSKPVSRILQSTWQNSGHLAKMRALKPSLFFEHDYNRDNMKPMLEQYRQGAETQKGAILFAYFRGSVSEGIDFRDNQCRALVTVGIPFGNFESVQPKMKYQKFRKTRGDDVLDDWEWYTADALKALNQAIGRVIRHSNDWGTIFNVDSRFFHGDNYESKLPQLIQDSIRNRRELSRYGNRTIEMSSEEMIQQLNSFLTHIWP